MSSSRCAKKVSPLSCPFSLSFLYFLWCRLIYLGWRLPFYTRSVPHTHPGTRSLTITDKTDSLYTFALLLYIAMHIRPIRFYRNIKSLFFKIPTLVFPQHPGHMWKGGVSHQMSFSLVYYIEKDDDVDLLLGKSPIQKSDPPKVEHRVVFVVSIRISLKWVLYKKRRLYQVKVNSSSIFARWKLCARGQQRASGGSRNEDGPDFVESCRVRLLFFLLTRHDIH